MGKIEVRRPTDAFVLSTCKHGETRRLQNLNLVDSLFHLQVQNLEQALEAGNLPSSDHSPRLRVFPLPGFCLVEGNVSAFPGLSVRQLQLDLELPLFARLSGFFRGVYRICHSLSSSCKRSLSLLHRRPPSGIARSSALPAAFVL